MRRSDIWEHESGKGIRISWNKVTEQGNQFNVRFVSHHNPYTRLRGRHG